MRTILFSTTDEGQAMRFYGWTFPRVAVGLVLIGTMVRTTSAADAVVKIDLLLQGSPPITAAQQWGRVLGEAGFSQPTIRSARKDDKVGIVQQGNERWPVYRVTGLLLRDGSIQLPPRARFTTRDALRLAKWRANLQENGLDAATQRTTAFGLTARRLESIEEDLRATVRKKTLGERPLDWVAGTGQTLNFRLTIEPAARRALAADAPIRDELQGLSTGTALAAVLRPAGLVLRPRFHERQLEYRVLESRNEGDNWPIGWSSDQSPGRLIPKLFVREETQQVEIPLAIALTELSGRVGAPFLQDHNSMAAHRIDPETLKVTMQAGRSHYGRTLERLLNQARLRYEIRVDENQKPFLWLSTDRPVKSRP